MSNIISLEDYRRRKLEASNGDIQYDDLTGDVDEDLDLKLAHARVQEALKSQASVNRQRARRLVEERGRNNRTIIKDLRGKLKSNEK